MNRDQVRIAIVQKVVTFCQKDKRRHLVIATFTGGGKTTNTLRGLDEAGIRWIYIGPNHEVIDENLDNSSYRYYNFLHLKGREKCCLRPEVIEMIKSGLEVSSICTDCPYLNTPCMYKTNYEKAYRERPNLAITHAHINTFLPKFLDTDVDGHKIREEYDCLIIDENPVKQFIPEKQIARNKLEELRQAFVTTNMEEVFIKILDLILAETINYEELKRISLDELKEYDTITKFSRRILEARTSGQIDYIPIDIIGFLFKIFERKHRNPLDKMIYWYENRLNLTYYNNNALDLGIKIIGLDGTASKVVWDNMLNDNLIEGDTLYRIDNSYVYDPENDCYSISYQMIGARYPISAWFNRKTQTRLCGYLDKIAAKNNDGRILIISTKAMKKVIMKNMQQTNYDFAHYYNLRSFNKYYKECDTVVLVCEPNPPQIKVDSCVALSGWKESDWRIIFTREEMLQAIGRLRANIKITPAGRERKLPLKVYIFPNTGIISYCECGKTYDAKTSRCECGKLLLKKPTLLPEATLIDINKIDEVDRYGEMYLDEDSRLRTEVLSACPTNPKIFKSELTISRRKIQSIFDSLREDGSIEIRKRGLYELTEKGYGRLPQTKKEEVSQSHS